MNSGLPSPSLAIYRCIYIYISSWIHSSIDVLILAADKLYIFYKFYNFS